MGVKIRYKVNTDKLPNIIRRLNAVDGTGVEVGVLQGGHAWLAGIHEYGCTIPVTPKMRAWFHYQGVHLSPNTTKIIIPERSFLRAGYDQHKDKVAEHAGTLLIEVAAGNMGVETLYQAVGLELASKIKEYALTVGPGNSGFTSDRKGSGHPLVDTGNMIGGITWRKAR